MATLPLLDARGVAILDRLYRDLYASWLRTRAREPLAAAIHLPKLPELLSLSVTALVWPVLFGTSVTKARSRHDLVTVDGVTVAVKGTGPAGWISVTKTDRTADMLVWVDYGPRIESGFAVTITVVRVCDGLSDAPQRLTRAQFQARVCRSWRLLVDPFNL